MIRIEDKAKCCGCTACYSVCPKGCISMKSDEEGFLYPQVDESKCVNCGLCNKVCPVDAPAEIVDENTSAKAMQLKDEENLFESASGGFFTAISKYVIEQGGLVCGAHYDANFNVKHYVASTYEECKGFRGSKYVQSELGDVFVKIKEALQKGILVCFSGTPCQVSGLKKYLGQEYDELITVDLVCAGVPSPKLWRSYLDKQEKKYGSKVRFANFRNKTFGYQCSTMKLEFENGKTYSKSGRVDPMMKFFVSGIAKRPSCYECVFKGAERCSDFTLFDAWHAKELIGKKDNDKGYTSVIVHTNKAKKILEKINDMMVCYSVDLEQAVKLDGIMVNGQPRKHGGRDEFYNVLNGHGIDECIVKYGKVTSKDKVLEKVKPILYRTGVIKMAKRLKKAIKKK
ncbi:MAG: 4Fe-4S dicluster domain-containing protein [Lachnospiraceae bacterium]|nr:4Fe-4S dicluster domain-containing protein [Lachnospiraceae bacterium]